MSATDKVELRGMAPLDLAQALDAIAMAKGLDRNSYVVQVLTDEVARYFTEDNLVPACRHCNASKGARTPQEWECAK